MTSEVLELKLPLDEAAIAAINDILGCSKETMSPERWAMGKILETVKTHAANTNTVRFGGKVTLGTFGSGTAMVSIADLGPVVPLESTMNGSFTLKVGPINRGRIERAYRYISAAYPKIGVKNTASTPEEWCLMIIREATGAGSRDTEATEGDDELSEIYPKK